MIGDSSVTLNQHFFHAMSRMAVADKVVVKSSSAFAWFSFIFVFYFDFVLLVVAEKSLPLMMHVC